MLLIYEEKDGNLSKSLGGVDKNILFQQEVLKGQMLELPEDGAFSLNDQSFLRSLVNFQI